MKESVLFFNTANVNVNLAKNLLCLIWLKLSRVKSMKLGFTVIIEFIVIKQMHPLTIGSQKGFRSCQVT